MVNVLITGGLGVNGSSVTRRLREKGHLPVVLENRPDTSLVADIAADIAVVNGDVTDLEGLVAVLRDHAIERIVHMAALMPGQVQADPFLGFTVNAMGAVTVFEAARRAGVSRVVFTSSKAAYGEIVASEHRHPNYQPIREDHPSRPVLVYDVCKVAAEGMGRHYRRDHGIEYAALRFGTIFGPGKLVRHGKVSILSQIVENAAAGRPTRIAQGGDQRDDMVYVEDVAAGVVAAVLADRLDHDTYNIGSGRGSTLHDFADAVRANIPDADIEIGPGLDYLQMGVDYYSVFDLARARADLGYDPQFDLADGVQHYLKTMQRVGLDPVAS
jgi:UDP-glucose 4-epimerase